MSPSTASLWPKLLIAGVATALICVASMMWVDLPLAHAMRTFKDTPFVATFAVITNLANGAIWYSAALIGMGVALIAARRDPARHGDGPLRRRLRAGGFIIVSMATSGLLVNGLKLVFGRDRPGALFENGVVAFHPFTQSLESWSFPSGHSQSIWAAMLGVAWIYPPARAACFALAILVSASRVIIDAHFLSDVIGGAYVAVVVAYFFRTLFERDGITLDLSKTAT